jgi:site-specific recombinase XerD
MLLLLYTSGMRASELVKARKLDIRKRVVDGVTAQILEIEGAKNTGKREITLLTEVWGAIKLYRESLDNPDPYYYGRSPVDPIWLFVSGKRPDERLTVRGLQSLLVRLGKRAGVHANPHLFRHTLATHMGNEGATLQHLMWFFGWKSPAMALRYCHKQTDTIVRTARMYNPLNSAVAELDRARERHRRMSGSGI